MNKLDRYDPGRPGTFRWIRVLDLGQTQEATGAQCVPPLRQAQVFFLEAGRMAMHRRLAETIAQGYFAAQWQSNPARAVEKVWAAWFATVSAHGSPKLKARANALKDALGFNLPILQAGQPQAPAPVSALPTGIAVPGRAVTA